MQPSKVVLDVDWGAAVEAAQRQGEGLRAASRPQAPRRSRLRGRGRPRRVRVYQSVVDAYMGRFARGVDEGSVEPSLVLRGSVAGDRSRPERAPARSGYCGEGASSRRSTASLSPTGPDLRSRSTARRLSTRDLVGAKVKAETGAVGSRGRRRTGRAAAHLSVRKIARILELPSNGDTELRLARASGRPFLRQRSRSGSSTPRRTRRSRSAARNVVRVVPAQPGRTLDIGGDDAAT